MTCRLIREAGLALAGVVVNRYHVDTPDLTEATNPRWLARQNRAEVLAAIPDLPASAVAPQHARLPAEVLDAVAMADWASLCSPHAHGYHDARTSPTQDTRPHTHAHA